MTDSEKVILREDLLFGVQTALQAERYEQMVDAMKDLVLFTGGKDLTEEERNLLSMAYKNITATRRSAWRILSDMERAAEEKRGEDSTASEGLSMKLKQTKLLRQEVENELKVICQDIIDQLATTFIPQAGDGESQVFYIKMKGDYYRYLAELGPLEKEAIENAHTAYKAADEIATKALSPIHPLRLGLALNYSVFCYEIMLNPGMGCEMAKNAFENAIAEMDSLNEDTYKDSTLILQLLRDNLSLWSRCGTETDNEEMPDKKRNSEMQEGNPAVNGHAESEDGLEAA